MQLLQQKVVDELAAARPPSSIPSLCGLPMWDGSSSSRPVSESAVVGYVNTQAAHHVKAALADPIAAASCGRRWLSHHPGVTLAMSGETICDDLALATAMTLGSDTLSHMESAAEAEEDWLVVYQAITCGFMKFMMRVDASTEKMMALVGAKLPLLANALLRLKTRPACMSQLAFEHFSIANRSNMLAVLATFGGAVQLDEGVEAEIVASLQTMTRKSQIAKLHPSYTDDVRWLVEVSPAWERGDTSADAAAIELWGDKLRRGVIDDMFHGETRIFLYENAVMKGHMVSVGAFARYIGNTSWDWTVFGPSGRCEWVANTLLKVPEPPYDAVQKMQEIDFMMLTMNGVLRFDRFTPWFRVLVLRGQLSAVHLFMDAILDDMAKFAGAMEQRKSNGVAGAATFFCECMVPMLVPDVAAVFRWLGREQEAKSALDVPGWSFESVDQTLDSLEMLKMLAYPRGGEDGPAASGAAGTSQLLPMEWLSWHVKLQYLLFKDPADLREAVATIPTVDTLHEWDIMGPRAIKYATSGFWSSLFLDCARVCERACDLDAALAYLDYFLAQDQAAPGADQRPNVHIEARTLRGRVFASLGQLGRAELDFEAAASTAERTGLWLLELLAAYHLQVLVLEPEGRSEEGKGALARAREKIDGTPAQIDAMLEAADLPQAISLPPSRELVLMVQKNATVASARKMKLRVASMDRLEIEIAKACGLDVDSQSYFVGLAVADAATEPLASLDELPDKAKIELCVRQTAGGGRSEVTCAFPVYTPSILAIYP